MLWIKAFHLVFVVTWFAAIFYLPRLFVYHAMATDKVSLDRFEVMERKLYRGIAMPSAILATLLGFWLMGSQWQYYANTGWLHLKIVLVALLWGYQLYCSVLLKRFAAGKNQHSDRFYRVLNELPVFLLIGIVILVVVKPF